MLRGKRMMCLFSLSLLINTYGIYTLTPFQSAMQITEKQVDNKEMVQTDIFGMVKHPIEIQIENKKLENEKKKAEEQKQKELKKKNEPEWQEFELTFYSSLDMENYQGCGGKTSTGSRLFDGVVASNYYKIDTKIKLEGWGEVIVLDRGSHNFDSDNRLDVYIPRLSNESDYQYHSRVEKMGIQKVKGFVIK